MHVGLLFDTEDDYQGNSDNKLFFDFATLSSANHRKEALELAGHTVEFLQGFPSFINALFSQENKFDVIFNNIEGIHSRNREAWGPAIMELKGIAYTGSDASAMCIAMDKCLTKNIAQSLGINVPRGEALYSQPSPQYLELTFEKIGGFMVIKPNFEGSSTGVVRVSKIDEADNAIRKALTLFETPILCEEYIRGQEITVPIIENRGEVIALEVIEYVGDEDGEAFEIFDQHSKKYDGGAAKIADIGEDVKTRAKKAACDIHIALGCRDISRSDFRLSPDGELFFLEINLLPTLSEDGAFGLGAKSQGHSFSLLLSNLLKNAVWRHNNRKYPAILSIPKT